MNFKRLKYIYHSGIAVLRRKKVTDEYLHWLPMVNAGMLDLGNVYSMDLAIRNLPSDAPVVEIGSFCGLSSNVIAYLLRKHGKANRIITTDRWIFEGADPEGNVGDSAISHAALREFVMGSFKRNVEFFSPFNKPHAIEAFADEFFELWNAKREVKDVFGRDTKLGGRISFAYVDGSHAYENVKRDFENIDANLELAGYILFDDSWDADPFGLTPLMRQIEKDPRYELVLKNPNYLFKKTR